MTNRQIRKPTPREAWEQYVTDSVELFISNFIYEGISDIKEMCRRYSKDIPHVEEKLFSQDQLDYIAELLEQHIYDYLKEIGGYNRLRLFSKEEIDRIDKEQIEGLFKDLSKY